MKDEECVELKNIEYQTMLLNQNSKIQKTTPNTVGGHIAKFLEKEKAFNKTLPWSKLSKASKLKHISNFITEYSKENKLKDSEQKQLRIYLLNCLDRKKLQRQKDVIYDKEKNKITAIPALTFNKVKNKFTLKRQDKKTNSLKCLAPIRKKNKTQNKSKNKSNKQKKRQRRKKTSKIDTNKPDTI